MEDDQQYDIILPDTYVILLFSSPIRRIQHGVGTTLRTHLLVVISCVDEWSIILSTVKKERRGVSCGELGVACCLFTTVLSSTYVHVDLIGGIFLVRHV